MNIPDEAVEAAAQALRDAFDWGVTDFDKQARAALEAAAPHMMAGAWDEGRETSGPYPVNPYKKSEDAS
jgi:hypothetical protein